MLHTAYSPNPSPLPPCPPAAELDALLAWIEWRHATSGHLSCHRWHRDAFWAQVEDKRQLRAALAAEIAADPAWANRVDNLAAAFALDLAGLDKMAQIDAAAAACLPLRFQISAELAHLRQRRRAQEVLATRY